MELFHRPWHGVFLIPTWLHNLHHRAQHRSHLTSVIWKHNRLLVWVAQMASRCLLLWHTLLSLSDWEGNICMNGPLWDETQKKKTGAGSSLFKIERDVLCSKQMQNTRNFETSNRQFTPFLRWLQNRRRSISKYTTFSNPENVFEFLMKSKFSPWTSAESSKVLRRRKWNKGVYSPPWSSINASESFDV